MKHEYSKTNSNGIFHSVRGRPEPTVYTIQPLRYAREAWRMEISLTVSLSGGNQEAAAGAESYTCDHTCRRDLHIADTTVRHEASWTTAHTSWIHFVIPPDHRKLFGVTEGSWGWMMEQNRTELRWCRVGLCSPLALWMEDSFGPDQRWCEILAGLMFWCFSVLGCLSAGNSDGGRGLSLEWTRMTSGVDPWRDGSRSSLPLFC